MMDRLHQQLQQILGSSTCTRASPDHVRIKTNAFCWFWMILSSQFPVNCQLGKSCCAGTCWFRREAAFPAWLFLVQTSWILLLCLLSSSKISWLQRSHQIARSLVPGPGKMSTLLPRLQAWEHKRSERSHGLSMYAQHAETLFLQEMQETFLNFPCRHISHHWTFWSQAYRPLKVVRSSIMYVTYVDICWWCLMYSEFIFQTFLEISLCIFTVSAGACTPATWAWAASCSPCCRGSCFREPMKWMMTWWTPMVTSVNILMKSCKLH